MTYREFRDRKYGLHVAAAAEDAAVECKSKKGPDHCSFHGPKLCREDEADRIPVPDASRMPQGAFAGISEKTLPKWFRSMYSLLAGRSGTEAESVEAAKRLAEVNGVWSDDLTADCKSKFGERFAHGQESDVYDAGDSVAKVVTMRLTKTPVDSMERIILHDRLFPDTALEVVGCGWANRYGKPDGKFSFLVKQPKVEFAEEPATAEEIAEFMDRHGFRKTEKNSRFVSKDGAFVAADMHRENVVKTADGKMAVLDSVMKLNVPDPKWGGEYDVSDPPKVDWSAYGVAKGGTMDSTPYRNLTWAELHDQALRLKRQVREAEG